MKGNNHRSVERFFEGAAVCAKLQQRPAAPAAPLHTRFCLSTPAFRPCAPFSTVDIQESIP